MTSEAFYNQLPKNKIELVNGQVLISGNIEVSRMVLAAILQGYGAEYIIPLLESELLQEACIEAFGRKKKSVASPATLSEENLDIPIARMASELRMNLFALDRFDVMGGDLVIKLDENAFTPDIYVNRQKHDLRQNEYFFDGAPDVIIEVMHPATRDFDAGLRLERYQAAGAPEIWLIDPASESIKVYRLRESSYTFLKHDIEDKLNCEALPGLTLHPSRLWQVKKNPWQNYRDLVSLNEASLKESPAQKNEKGITGMGSNIRIPFSPNIQLMSTPITFEEFISWAPEAKFEWMDDKPHIGGGYDTNLHLTGLLLMTFGLTEAVGMLPAEAWSKHLK